MTLPSWARVRPSALAITTVLATVAALQVGAAAAAEPAEGQIRYADPADAIAGSYIVVFKDTAVARGEVTGAAARLSDRHGGTVDRTYRAAVRGFEVSTTRQSAARIAADPDVAYVEQNRVVRALETQDEPPSWGLDRIDQRSRPLDRSFTYPDASDDVRVYVIDTGVRFAHSDFGGRASSGFDAVDGGGADDCNGHGTHVAGTAAGSAYGVAKRARIVAVRVLDCDGYGDTAGVVDGIDWITENARKPAVANMSLGGPADGVLDDAVRASIDSGVSYVVAAGNGDWLGRRQNACDFSPARVPGVVTVGSTDSGDVAAGSSNYGTCVDVLAPGVRITSAWYTGNSATRTISGTSMASPHVAGAAALLLAANPTWTPSQVSSALTDAATPGVVTNPGPGTPNRLLFIASGDSGEDPPDPPDPPEPPAGEFTGTNDTDTPIPDAGPAVESEIVLTGTGRPASATSTIEVRIIHSYRGDLRVDLVAPDGTAYRLKNTSGSDSGDDVIATYTRDLGAETVAGTWRLRVLDIYEWDTGYLDTWTLTV